MKRMWKHLSILVLLAALLMPRASAAGGESAILASQFRQDGFLYVFTALKEWPDGLTAELRSGDLARDIPSAEQPRRAADSGTPVSYLLLVDCSTSMARYQSQVTNLTRKLAEADETGAVFTVAIFGELFRTMGSGLSGDEAVKAVEAINYIAQRTDISQGILDAVEYLHIRQRQAGELVNLVVITDGIPRYSEDSPAVPEVARILDETPSILVHTVGFGSSTAGLSLLVSLGRGLHVPGQASKGTDIAGYVNELCVTRFPWDLEGPRGAAEVRFAWDSEGEMFLPVDLNQEPLPSGGAGAEQENPMNSASLPDIIPAPGETMGGEAVETAPPAASEGIAETAPPGGGAGASSPLIWVIPAAILVLLLAAVLIRWGTKRQKRRRTGIPMHLEVLSGTPSNGTGALLYLTDELTIGRSGRCDIVWRDKDVSPRNSRIFLKNRMIYIEDLGSACGTALGGMRLHEPNRLRSGDEISIGSVRFVLKF